MTEDGTKAVKHSGIDAPHFHEVRQVVLGLMHTMSAEHGAWAMETVKHIALVALAGLAGVFGLLQANKGDSALAVCAALAFGSGSVVAVTSLYLGAWVRKRYLAKVLAPMMEKIGQGSLPQQADFSPSWVAPTNKIVFAVGLTSALLTLEGAIILFMALP